MRQTFQLRDALVGIAVIAVGAFLYREAVGRDSSTHFYDEAFIAYVVGVVVLCCVSLRMRGYLRIR